MFIRTEFNYDMNAASEASGLACKDKSRAVQSSKMEADINTIVKRFRLTGQLPSNIRMPTYADFDQVHDYHSALVLVRQAAEEFMLLPANVRSRFGNDPESLLSFLEDPANRDEAVKLGLLVPVDSQALPVSSAGPAAVAGGSTVAPGAAPGPAGAGAASPAPSASMGT